MFSYQLAFLLPLCLTGMNVLDFCCANIQLTLLMRKENQTKELTAWPFNAASYRLTKYVSADIYTLLRKS